jgi:hypothetical protein
MLEVRVANNEKLARRTPFDSNNLPVSLLAFDHRYERRDVRGVSFGCGRPVARCFSARHFTQRGTRYAVTITEFANARAAGQNVVVQIEGIGAETVTSA